MKTSPKGIALIKEFEGLELEAYPDPATGADPITIGYGHTGPEVHLGMTITEAQAEAYLVADLEKFERAVEQAVTVPMTQEQFDACVSLCYNIGPWNFKTSSVVKLLNAGDAQGAADIFPKWNKANKKVMAGLIRRRNAERELFLS